MEYHLKGKQLVVPTLPASFEWTPYDDSLIVRHAATKYHSFRTEMDVSIFPNLGSPSGCANLMSSISQQDSFVSSTTWLLSSQMDDNTLEDCGTIQGLAASSKLGAIQNIGVIPEYRGLGLGRALVLKALTGFQQAGFKRVFLEVTANNKRAVKLYRSLGFQLTRTMFNEIVSDTQEELTTV